MADDNRGGWKRLPKMNFNSRVIKKRIRQAHGATIKHAHRFITNRWSSFRESQQHITRWVLVMGILLAATGLQLMWYQNNYRTTARSNDGTYAEAVLGPVDTLNPIFADSSAEQSASYLLFSRLMSYDTTGHLGYDIANGVTVNDTKTVYTVSIRPDVLWHDGAKLTTADIAFTLDLIKDANVRSTIEGWENISVRVISDTVIEFSIPSAYSAFRHLLTFPILPKHILGLVEPINIREASFSQDPIGSGPFRLNYVQDINTDTGQKVIYMVRNQSYYGGMTKLSRFQLHVYSTADGITKALSTNEVNAATDLSPIEFEKIDKEKYETSSTPIQSGVYAILNTTSTTLQEAYLRKALQLATNTLAIRNSLGVNSPSLDLPLTNAQLSGDVPKADGFDLAAANNLLNDNGWVVGGDGLRSKNGQTLKLSVVVMKDSELEKVLGIIAAQWQKLNIDIETRVVDPDDISQNVVQGILQPRNYDVLLYRLNIGADPDVYAYWHSSQANTGGLNFSNYSDQISDDALTSARARTEQDLRNAKYLTFVRQWLSDVPAIGLYQSTIQYVSVKDIKSFNSSNTLILSTDRYSDVLNWSVGAKDVYKTP